MSGETELKQIVARLIDLGKLLAEAEQHGAGEQKKINPTEAKLRLANAKKATSHPKRSPKRI